MEQTIKIYYEGGPNLSSGTTRPLLDFIEAEKNNLVKLGRTEYFYPNVSKIPAQITVRPISVLGLGVIWVGDQFDKKCQVPPNFDSIKNFSISIQPMN